VATKGDGRDDDQPRDGEPGDDQPRDGEPGDGEPGGAPTKTDVQVRLIQSELDAVGVDPPDWADTGQVNYLYRQGVILVRDADLPRVREVLDGDVQDSLIDGLTRYAPKVPTLEALGIVEQALGIGVATPDHVLYASIRSFCPATEPKPPARDVCRPEPRMRGKRHQAGAGVRVSVVDTGWWPPAEQAHSWLEGVTGDQENPFDGQGRIRSYGGHGTFAAGVVRAIARQSTVRVEGILPKAGAWFESDIVRQLYDAVAWAPDIISLQAGTTARNHRALLGFQVLWETRLRHCHGTVLVAAAGNDGTSDPFWPAAFPWAVAVGGLTKDEKHRASWSNYGPWVDVYALGDDHVNAFVDGTFVTVEPESPAGEQRVFDGMAIWSGTSFSTPLVAGLIAARMSRTGEDAPRAARKLLRKARSHALPGVGPVLKSP
jgi:subtilisin family serine protease